MIQGEHSAILLTFFKIFVLSIFEWQLKTGFTVYYSLAFSESTLSAELHNESYDILKIC